MTSESGRIVAIEQDCLWVETIRKSTCGSCSAKKGCGHSLLNEIGTGRENHIRVLLNGRSADQYSVNDNVTFSVPEQIIVVGALIVYLVPLMGLLVGAVLASIWWTGDIAAFIGAVAGFSVGFTLVKLHSTRLRNNEQWQPVVAGSRAAHITFHEPDDVDINKLA